MKMFNFFVLVLVVVFSSMVQIQAFDLSDADPLIHIKIKTWDPEVRLAAVKDSYLIKDIGLRTRLLLARLQDENAHVRAAAIDALCVHNLNEAAVKKVFTLKDDENVYVRVAVADFCGSVSPRSLVLEMLKEMVSDSDYRVRFKAIESLGYCGREALSILIGLTRGEGKKSYIARAIMHVGESSYHHENGKTLNFDLKVAELKNGIIADLEKIAMRDNDKEIRNAARNGIKSIEEQIKIEKQKIRNALEVMRGYSAQEDTSILVVSKEKVESVIK